jgi:hypothetical protein
MFNLRIEFPPADDRETSRDLDEKARNTAKKYGFEWWDQSTDYSIGLREMNFERETKPDEQEEKSLRKSMTSEIRGLVTCEIQEMLHDDSDMGSPSR